MGSKHTAKAKAKAKAKARSSSEPPRLKDENDLLLESRGELQTIAASILMRLLYAARNARFDLLRSINKLASHVAFWDADCDKRLCRLVGYVQATLHLRQIGWIGDKAEDLAPETYSDADFAGCARTLRSTSGIHLNLEGAFSCFPISARSVRQGCCSFSTPEAEIVSLNLAFRTLTLPALDLWETLLPGRFLSIVHEDNQACIQVITTGKNPTMRYLGRTHGVSIQFLHENLGVCKYENNIALKYTDSPNMVADIHTKAFPVKEKWIHASNLCNVFSPEALKDRVYDHHARHEQDASNPGGEISNTIVEKTITENSHSLYPESPIAFDDGSQTIGSVALAVPAVVIDKSAMADKQVPPGHYLKLLKKPRDPEQSDIDEGVGHVHKRPATAPPPSEIAIYNATPPTVSSRSGKE